MRLALIDLGTNSVRFVVHELGPEKQVFEIYREKLMIRLGEGVFLRGHLDRRSMELCVQAFKSFKQTIDDFRVRRVLAFGTSAIREAADSPRLLNRIKKEAGIDVQVISGKEEARLIARGILANEAGIRGRFALVDIGGGSTEVTVCVGRKILHSESFPLGTARLQQVFLKDIPPVPEKPGAIPTIEALRRHIRGVLLYKLITENWPKTTRILGSSGTSRALLKILKRRHGSDAIYRRELDELVNEMSTMTREELRRIPGMETRRTDMILSGAILLQEIMNALHADRVEPTEFSLRDGMLDEQLELLHRQKKLDRIDVISDLKQTALDLGLKEPHLNRNMELAKELFDRLRPLHRLKPEWRLYLKAASLLFESGRSISPIHYASHSAYIARFADVPVLEDWESELISHLCFHAMNNGNQKKDFPYKKDATMRAIFTKLLAILRLVAAISYQREKPAPIQSVKIEPRRVTIRISKRSSPYLALLRVDQKKQVFEDIFRRQLVVEAR